jgi:hypothetical protein
MEVCLYNGQRTGNMPATLGKHILDIRMIVVEAPKHGETFRLEIRCPALDNLEVRKNQTSRVFETQNGSYIHR